MIKKLDLSSNIQRLGIWFITGLLCVIFLFLSIESILSTAVIDPINISSEHIIYSDDNIIVNLAIILGAVILMWLLIKLTENINIKLAAAVLILYATAISSIWVISVKSIPAADSGSIVKAAAAFLNGDYSALKTGTYFRYYPFQLGFTFICELLMKVFGSDNYTALALVNVLFLDISYLAIIRLTGLIFHNKKVELLTILLLALCIQPMLLCTFIYGIIIGLAFALWAVVLEIEYLKTGKRYKLLIAALFIAIAVAAKPNYYIVVAAMCIILLLDFLKTRSWFNLAAVALTVVLSFGMLNLIISSYEHRADTDLGSGIPQIAWTAMGLQESQRAPGWYNKYTANTFEKSGMDSASTYQKAKENITERLETFSSSPEYAADFFSKKVLSQWNEPTYESVWVSQVKKHVTSVPAFVDSVYTGELGSAIKYSLNILQELIFFGFVLALISGLKKPDLIFTLLPLIVLGGFLYHLINEAKSQYILIYFVMLIPYAAYGLCGLVSLRKKSQTD